MEQYKPIFRRTYDLLKIYCRTVIRECLDCIEQEITAAASVFEKEMLRAAADELARIQKIKKIVTGIYIDVDLYKPAFLMSFYLLEKYHLTICDELWYEIAQSMGGPETKFEVALMVAAVNELERIYKMNPAANPQSDQAGEKQTA